MKNAPIRPQKRIDPRFLKRLPAFSPLAVRLLAVMGDERTAYKEVARLIALDPVLAGEVLRLANSGLYGRRFEVRSILQAIALLGIGRVSQIAVTAALWRGLSRRTSLFVREWWRHNVAAALIARRCNQESPSDFAYTAGLLHGIGQLALFEDAPLDYPGLVERAFDGGFDLMECERAVFGVDHVDLADFILTSWGLPEDLCAAAAQHPALQTATSLDTRLVRAVQTGCAGAEYAGFGRCGCHLLLAQGVPAPLAELLADDYPIGKLHEAVNHLECSLL